MTVTSRQTVPGVVFKVLTLSCEWLNSHVSPHLGWFIKLLTISSSRSRWLHLKETTFCLPAGSVPGHAQRPPVCCSTVKRRHPPVHHGGLKMHHLQHTHKHTHTQTHSHSHTETHTFTYMHKHSHSGLPTFAQESGCTLVNSTERHALLNVCACVCLCVKEMGGWNTVWLSWPTREK